MGREVQWVSVTGPTRRCSLQLNPPVGSLNAKSIRSCLKCWRLIDLTFSLSLAGGGPPIPRPFPVIPERQSLHSSSIIAIERSDPSLLRFPLHRPRETRNSRVTSTGVWLPDFPNFLTNGGLFLQ